VPADAASKDLLGVDGTTVIPTFGLLSRDKGVVLGATHPHVQ
jgi:hypothetical protein